MRLEVVVVLRLVEPVVGNQQRVSKVSLAALAEDTAGNLWPGGNMGALQFIRTGLTAWSHADGLSNDLPLSILRGVDGSIYAITSDSRINRFDPGEKPPPALVIFPPLKLDSTERLPNR